MKFYLVALAASLVATLIVWIYVFFWAIPRQSDSLLYLLPFLSSFWPTLVGIGIGTVITISFQRFGKSTITI